MDFDLLRQFSFLSEMLSDSGKASLTEKLLIVGVVWFVMGRKVAKHFTGLESSMTSGFRNVTASIEEVRKSLETVEHSHGTKIDELNQRVGKLEGKQD